MATDITSARECISRCNHLRDEGRSEAVLRSELASRLRQIFPDPDDQSWVNHYSEGTEARTDIRHTNGTSSHRFVDNLVRSTVVEYEPDLRLQPRFDQGHQQVKEYVAGALRAGTPLSQVRGVLSDTVQWYVYDASIPDHVETTAATTEDITLTEVEALSLDNADDSTASRLVEFLRKHFARQQSRLLSAESIAVDLGLESSPYARQMADFSSLVNDGRSSEPSILLATDLWSQFVDCLERSHVGEFRTSAYVDEAYIAILARLLCANILERRALLSDDEQLTQILTGELFSTQFYLHNMVEQDYFGWLWRMPHINSILPVAREIQRDLYAYDFSQPANEDLFGQLMSQLARRTERKLLGQEWTPQWVARQLVDRCLSLLPTDQKPQLIDMCCGSGSIIAEILKATRTRHPSISFNALSLAATGFDVDPLAVLLAKTAWVVTLADELRSCTAPVIIPIYHADSLFAVTPLSTSLPLPGDTSHIVVELDGHSVSLPPALIEPDCRPLFDGIVDWTYDEARDAQATGTADAITETRVQELVHNLIEQYELDVDDDLRSDIQRGVLALAQRMSQLAVEDRNGIWAFILRNTYRPSLLAGQFNGLVSNPPWLAMSQFADNPYKDQLSARAIAYGIKPSGAAHLHLELATTHLLHAIDRYLCTNAAVACLVPGTLLNGQHHAKFRDAAYLQADRPVPFELREIWTIAPGTFKVRSAAVVGGKLAEPVDVSASPSGIVAAQTGTSSIPFTTRQLGSRTAWVLAATTSQVQQGTDTVPPQGADLMPRPAVCVEILDRRGREWKVRTPRSGDPSHFAVKGAKKLKSKSFDGSVAPEFIHRMVQSLNLLPFICDQTFVDIAIPARLKDDGEWEIMNSAAIRTAGYTNTARRFQRIDIAMSDDNVVKPLFEKIDERNKLSLQVFDKDFIVLNGAGGGVVCSAFLPLAQYPDIVIDQTLYWSLVSTEEEAWYRVGIMNTDSLSEAIREFNPEGELGPRHLHTLPNRVIPVFDDSNADHNQIAQLAEKLSMLAQPMIATDTRISDPAKPIASRRRRLRNLLKVLPEFSNLEDAAVAALAGSDD